MVPSEDQGGDLGEILSYRIPIFVYALTPVRCACTT
jgi:hypothetical protein